jgi:hypothetical protein
MEASEFKHTVRIGELWLFERTTKPAFQGVALQLGMMGSIQAFRTLESALRDQRHQFVRYAKATRLIGLGVPWEYRAEWTQSYLNGLFWNNRRMRFSFFKITLEDSDTPFIDGYEVCLSPHNAEVGITPQTCRSGVRTKTWTPLRRRSSDVFTREATKGCPALHQAWVSRARHNPHKIGVGATDIPHPPSPTGPFIFPTFSGIGPAIFPTC